MMQQIDLYCGYSSPASKQFKPNVCRMTNILHTAIQEFVSNLFLYSHFKSLKQILTDNRSGSCCTVIGFTHPGYQLEALLEQSLNF